MLMLFLRISGGLLILAGGVFFLQGIGILPGSFMSGQMRWAIYGSLMIVAGGGLIYFSSRQRKLEPPT